MQNRCMYSIITHKTKREKQQIYSKYYIDSSKAIIHRNNYSDMEIIIPDYYGKSTKSLETTG